MEFYLEPFWLIKNPRTKHKRFSSPSLILGSKQTCAVVASWALYYWWRHSKKAFLKIINYSNGFYHSFDRPELSFLLAGKIANVMFRQATRTETRYQSYISFTIWIFDNVHCSKTLKLSFSLATLFYGEYNLRFLDQIGFWRAGFYKEVF